MKLLKRTQAKEFTMANVYVKPEPKRRSNGTPITHYVLELAGGVRFTNTEYPTQADAIHTVKAYGYHPLVARVRHTDKGNHDHWRSA